MKKIVFVCQTTGYLMVDIINHFPENYSNVSLIAGHIESSDRSLNSKVQLTKIISYNKKNIVTRTCTWFYSMIQISYYLFFKFKNHEIVYVTNPPMSYFLSLFIKNTFSIIVFDIYPDALKNINIGSRNIIYKLWVRVNKIVFNKAKLIFTIGSAMAVKLEQYVKKEKVILINNWSGFNEFKEMRVNENLFIKNNCLENKFIVMYSGNLGFTHSLEAIIEVAKRLIQDEHIKFVFIGEGKKKKMLLKLTKDYNLTNCLFLPWQDKDNVRFTLSCANLGVVTLNKDTASLSVPSKTYNLLACGAPILSIAPDKSELSDLIKKYNNGANFNESNIDLICQYIIEIKNDVSKQNKLSKRSQIASRDFTYSNAKKYLSHIDM